MHELEILTSLLPPPSTETIYDWESTETALGFTLPADYKAFAQAYGRGTISEFLTVLVPSGPGGIAGRGRELRGYVGELLAAGQQAPAGLKAQDPAVFGWGGTGNGDICLWHTNNADPDQWNVLITDTKGTWERYPGGMVTYLSAMLSGKATSGIIDFATLISDSGLSFTPITDS